MARKRSTPTVPAATRITFRCENSYRALMQVDGLIASCQAELDELNRQCPPAGIDWTAQQCAQERRRLRDIIRGLNNTRVLLKGRYDFCLKTGVDSGRPDI